MSTNKTFHHVWVTFDNDDHPVVIEWFNRRLIEAVNHIKTELKLRTLRDDKINVEVHGDGVAYRFTFITNFLGDAALYANIMTHINQLIDQAEQYVGIKVHFDNVDVRKNRFTITKDLGLMINSTAPIEVRDVGLAAKTLQGIRDIWVAGEPNACRKLVGKIRYYLRYCNQYKEGYEVFEEQIRRGIGKDVAIYVRTDDDQLFGRVIHDSSYDVFDLQAPIWESFKQLTDAGKVPDIFNFSKSYGNNYDFMAFMTYMLEIVDNRRISFKGFGGSEVIPYEFISSALEEVSE